MKTLVLLFAVLAVAYGSQYVGQQQHRPVTLPGQRPHAVPSPRRHTIPPRRLHGGVHDNEWNQGKWNNGHNRPAGGQTRPQIPNHQGEKWNQHNGNIQNRPAGGHARPAVPSYSNGK
ncbi:uncharacterized protein LOC135942714 [Cloeon dipterum]|uniref:uncharacterized protein LOC135942714 n=1 Tax=Cloeon dipterum TaxID=197152 RepID=UPI00321F9873